MVCPLAWATHYFLVAANVFRKPGIACPFFDDFLFEVPPPDDKGIWFDVFLRKGAFYVHNLRNVLFSWWPILPILGELTSTAVLYYPGYYYVRPFYNGLADMADREGPPAMIEAGAHDGS